MLLLLAQYFAQRWIVERIIFIEYLSNILKGNKHLSLFEPDKYLLDVHCSVIVIFLHFFCLYRHAIFIKYWCYDLCCEKDSQKEATISKKKSNKNSVQSRGTVVNSCPSWVRTPNVPCRHA